MDKNKEEYWKKKYQDRKKLDDEIEARKGCFGLGFLFICIVLMIAWL